MSLEIPEKLRISIKEIITKAPPELELKILAGKLNLDTNFISSTRLQKLGLAIAGYSKYVHSERIHMIGQSEVSYLSQLDVKAKSKAINSLNIEKSNCVLITKKLDIPERLLTRFAEHHIPVLQTPLSSSLAISCLSEFLRSVLAPTMTIHGVMIGMYGLGILILGESGIGKSECALDLIRLGHRLISDDSVQIKKIGDKLSGSSPEATFELMEIRGLGIINIKDLFGVSAIGKKSRIDLCLELKKWDTMEDIDRLGLTMQNHELFDIKIPKFVLPVSSGRNTTTLVETAIRLHLLKAAGHNAAKDFITRHKTALNNN
jgi:HPr kinase/phosphorylase